MSGGSIELKIITNYQDLKNVNQSYEYVGVGYTKGNLFNITHENMYQLCRKLITPTKKLFGIVWNNTYDYYVVTGKEYVHSFSNFKFENQKIIDWFSEREFEYLFLPPDNFIHELRQDELYNEAYQHVCEIFKQHNYFDLIRDENSEDDTGQWIKYLLTRHYLFFGGVVQPRVFNRTDVLLAPDGTWGYIYRHFFVNYCHTNCSMIPVIRTEGGLPFDPAFEKIPPDTKKDLEYLSVFFNQFRRDHLEKELEKNINNYLSGISKTDLYLKLKSIIFYKNELTFNKYVIRLWISCFRKVYDIVNKEMYRIWEYDEGI